MKKRNAIVSGYDKDNYAKIKEADRLISKKLYEF